jgi:hypothetical protein
MFTMYLRPYFIALKMFLVLRTMLFPKCFPFFGPICSNYFLLVQTMFHKLNCRPRFIGPSFLSITSHDLRVRHFVQIFFQIPVSQLLRIPQASFKTFEILRFFQGYISSVCTFSKSLRSRFTVSNNIL